METSELAKDFFRPGWVKVPQLLEPTDLPALREVVAEVTAEEIRPTPGREGFGADQALDDYRHVLQIPKELRFKFPVIFDIAKKVAPVARDVLGVPSVRLWSDRLYIKPGQPFGSRATSWHQDAPKLPVDRRGQINVWIALDDVPVKRGPMVFASGSHRLGSFGAVSQLTGDPDLSEILQGPDWEFITGCDTVPVKAGDATFHHGLTLHRALINNDEVDRVALAFHMIDADALYTGAASAVTDGFGMQAFGPFDEERFPVLA
jgi:ectoine hydroxylase-related dioxygenase (phytanoyl-CoA dioxygenase family)